jgi:hypothetical protein
MNQGWKPPISHVMVWKKKDANSEHSQPTDCEADPPKKVGLARQLQLLAIQHNLKATKKVEESIPDN